MATPTCTRPRPYVHGHAHMHMATPMCTRPRPHAQIPCKTPPLRQDWSLLVSKHRRLSFLIKTLRKCINCLNLICKWFIIQQTFDFFEEEMRRAYFSIFLVSLFLCSRLDLLESFAFVNINKVTHHPHHHFCQSTNVREFAVLMSINRQSWVFWLWKKIIIGNFLTISKSCVFILDCLCLWVPGPLWRFAFTQHTVSLTQGKPV